MRVGLAAVKGWGEVYGKPIAAVSVLEAIAGQARASGGVLVPVLDARRGEIYLGFYRRKSENGAVTLVAEGEMLVMAPGDFLAEVQAKVGNREFAIVTPTPEVFAGELGRVNGVREGDQPILVERVPAVLAPVVGEIGWRHAQAGSLADSLMLDANYVRRTDAELKWKGT